MGDTADCTVGCCGGTGVLCYFTLFALLNMSSEERMAV